MNKIEILDCTLRDGSYVIDNHFSKSDTSIISSILFNSGINYLEVGHGLGLGASSKKYGKSLCSDEDYIYNASISKTSKSNKVGVFCFPHITNKNQIKKAKESGLDFIRIGIDLDNIENSRGIIQYSKELGLEVFANLIKTYAYSPLQISKKAKKLEKFGADIICLVDSAGAMLPDEIKEYFQITKKILNKKTLLNFHGHNNLGFANSNCIQAIEGGANIVDSSIMGMGRSAGNAVTEMIIPALQRKGLISKNIDLILILNLAKSIVSKLNPKTFYDPESILHGKSYFHSGFKKKLIDFTKKNNISYYNILNNFSFKKVLNFNEDLLKKTVLKDKKKFLKKNELNIKYPNINISKNLEFNNLVSFKKYLKSEKERKKIEIIVSICRSKTNNFKILGVYQNYMMAHIESKSKFQDQLILNDFRKNEIFIDEKIYYKNYKSYKNIYRYSEKKIFNEAKNLFLDSENNFLKFEISKKKNLKLINKINKINNLLIIIKTINKDNIKILKMIKKPFNLLVYENLKIDIKKVKTEVKNIKKVFRLNYGVVLSLEILKILHSVRVCQIHFGKKIYFNKTLIISGGIIGDNNSLVVDNVEKPSRIIGFADGYGGIKNQQISLEKQVLLKKLILDKNSDL